MKHLKRAKIKLNLKPSLIQIFLPFSHYFLHGLVWSNKQPMSMGDIHIIFQLLGHIPSVGNNQTVNILIDLAKDIPIIGLCSGKS